MKIFGVSEASHYCKKYTDEIGDANGSINTFLKNKLFRKTNLHEGSQLFNEYRSCSLREVERNLFFAASHYRRCLDLMIPSASSWAYVTTYYGSWFAAHALLGMFGCGVFDGFIIDVNLSEPGNQELSKRDIGSHTGEENTTYRGSHQKFWDFFYNAFTPLRPIVPTHLVAALTPIAGDHVWQIRNRNLINYDTFEAIKLGQDFKTSFSKTKFPSCLPGILSTQYGILDAMIELSFLYARQFNLRTDALSGFGVNDRRNEKIRRLIYCGKHNDLVKQSKKELLLKKEA